MYSVISKPTSFQTSADRSLSEIRNVDAFAAIKADGSVVTWGYSADGGDSTKVSSQLNGLTKVKQIYSSPGAFAALMDNGSVVAWGNANFGGTFDTANDFTSVTTVSDKLNGTIDVIDISSTGWAFRGAFAATRADGSVVTWGDKSLGGDSSTVASQLNGDIDVVKVFSNEFAFAALRADGSVATWGDSSWGGDSSKVAAQLNGDIDVVKVFSNWHSLAALKADGSVVTWGGSLWGGDSSKVSTQLNGDVDVKQIISTSSAYAAIRTDGSVVTWGETDSGGDSSLIADKLNGTIDVVDVTATNSSSKGAFAALRVDGSVVTWGKLDTTIDIVVPASQIDGSGIDVTKVYATDNAFAALRADGSVVTFGNSGYGADSGTVASKLNGDIDVISIFSTKGAFAALKADGSVVAWGSSTYGGDSSKVDYLLTGNIPVTQVFTSNYGFAALRADGAIINWGGFNGTNPVELNGNVDVIGLSNVYTDDIVLPNITGNDSNVPITGTALAELINGLAGNDTILPGAGSDIVNGGDGDDTVVYTGNVNSYTIKKQSNAIVVNNKNTLNDTDNLTGIEHLKFDDKVINFSIQEKATTILPADLKGIEELYMAFFRRIPDADGLSYWIDEFKSGKSLIQIADAFYNAGIQYSSVTGYTSDMTNVDFIKIIYANVLGRTGATAPNSSEVGYWDTQLTNGIETRGSLVNTMLNVVHTQYANDPVWGWVGKQLNNKVDVAHQFAVDWGLGYSTPEASILNGMSVASAVTVDSTTAAINLIGVQGVFI